MFIVKNHVKQESVAKVARWLIFWDVLHCNLVLPHIDQRGLLAQASPKMKPNRNAAF